jgi:Tfp pilus assembly protein PilF
MSVGKGSSSDEAYSNAVAKAASDGMVKQSDGHWLCTANRHKEPA